MNELTRNIIDAVAGPVFVLERDQQGRLIYTAFNRAACESSGFRLEDIIGKTAKEIYPGRAGKIAYDRHLQVARSKTPLIYQIFLPFGEETRLVRTTLQPIMDESGKTSYLVGTSHDLVRDVFVSEIRANAQILNSESEEFISVAAHDLRSPVRQVRGITDLLKKDFEDLGDGKLELIGLLEKVTIKATKLLSEVLSYAQAVKLGEEFTGFAFQDLCAELMTVLDADDQHTLQHDEARLVADRTALQIVLRNLIDNAIKHSGRDRVTLDVRLRDIGDGFLQFTVRDNGKGFDDESIVLLGSTRMADKSGFGLASIRRLIKTRGGSLVIEKRSNEQGTAIIFTFPGRVQMISAEDATLSENGGPSAQHG
jgi:hypothetical protein